MNTIKFKSTVSKGNNRGAGFIRFPMKIRSNFFKGDQYKVRINSKIEYYSKIRNYCGNGLFIPTLINLANDLTKKEVSVELWKIDGFYTKIGPGGRVYIPNHYKLHERDIVEIIAIIEGKEIVMHPRIYFRERQHVKEFIFYLNSDFEGQTAIIEVNRIFKKNELIANFPSELLEDFEFAEIGNNRMIIYFGNRVPIIINLNITINKLVYYLGCYFADGTKRGNDWGICASTFEQARYFISKHKKIISDSNIIYSLTCTIYGEHNSIELKNRLSKIWLNKTGSIIENKRIRIIKTETKYAPNRNPYGSLVMKEHRQLTQIYYKRLIHYLFKIIENGDKDLATDFICGVMEGDGCVNSKTHGHIIITTNNEEIKILKNICDKSYLKSSIRSWKGKKNRIDLLIGSLEIIENIPLLRDKLFKYYPKRRRILKERLGQTGCARYLLGKSKKTSNWLIGQLNKRGILDGNGNLTKKGGKIKRNLRVFLDTY